MGLPATTRVLTTERRVTDAGAPREMPADLRDAYTRCGAVPVADYFVDDSWGGKGSSYAYPAADMARFVDDAAAFLQLLQRNNARQGRRRGGKEAWLGQAILQHRQKFDGGDVLVFGSMTPRIEALALAAGAAVVVTSEYNELVYDHEKVRIVTPDELERHDAYAGAFHVALSISSFDHDGLGRYNDPLAPDGDLMAMDSAVRARLAVCCAAAARSANAACSFAVEHLTTLTGTSTATRRPAVPHGPRRPGRCGVEPASTLRARAAAAAAARLGGGGAVWLGRGAPHGRRAVHGVV